MPQAGVSVPRGRVHQDLLRSEPDAEERFDDRPYTGPLPVRAGTTDGDWELVERAVAAAPRPTRSARPAPVADDRESLRNARAAIASWEEAGHRPIDSWDAPSRPRRSAASEMRAEPDVATGPIRAPRPTPVPRSAVTTAAAMTSSQAGAGIPGRRTVQIQGRGTERYNAGFERRRPPRRPHERDGFRPDRAAMWAVLLGLVLVLVAATSSHAAVLAHHIH